MESAPSVLCPLLSAAGVPDCSLNSSLAPVFLSIAALCALAFLVFAVFLFWPPTGNAGSVLIDVLKAGGVVLGQFALLALAWMFYLVPYERIPFVSPPVSGSFLLWTAPMAYGFVAGALHIVVPTLALQFTLGLVFGEILALWEIARGDLPKRENTVYMNCVAILGVVVVWYCVQESQWPAVAATWVQLALGLSAATLLAQRVIAPYMRPTANAFRVQHLAFLLTGLIIVTLIWQRHTPVFLESVGVISRRDNPVLYPYLLMLLVVVLVVWGVGLLVRPGRFAPNGAYVSSLGGTQYTILITFVSVYLLWLGLATPWSSFPFLHPQERCSAEQSHSYRGTRSLRFSRMRPSQ